MVTYTRWANRPIWL